MIGWGDNKASPTPGNLTFTKRLVILPGRPSDSQLEFGIPVIRDATFDWLHLEFALGRDCSPVTGTSDRKASNSDTVPGLPGSSADFIKGESRSSHHPSAPTPLSQEKSDAPVQDKSHSVEATSDGSVLHTASCVGTATAESDDRMAEDAMDDKAVPCATCPDLAECSTGFIEAASTPIQTPPWAGQEKRDYNAIQDDQSSSTDLWPGGFREKHSDALLSEAGLAMAVQITSKPKPNKPLVAPRTSSKQPEPSNRTGLNAVNRSSVWYKNSWKGRLAKR